MEEEIWKDIPGYEGLYQVSTFGRVRNINYKYKGYIRYLSLINKPPGYKFVSLNKSRKSRHWYVHVLVGITFIPNPEKKPFIDHIDGNPSNNHVSNLRWCTRKENQNNPITRARISEAGRGRKHTAEAKRKIGEASRVLKRKPVIQYTIDWQFIREWPSIMDAALGTGLCIQTISNACKGRTSPKKYQWRFK